jgi:hypothetical protein
VRTEELAKQGARKREAGQSECTLCNTRYFPLFGHRCLVVEQNIKERLDPPRKRQTIMSRTNEAKVRRRIQVGTPNLPDVTTPDDNPFIRFTFFNL